ncbi:RNA polymerase sigma factor [Allomuricauda sp. SCSIO 65647]|uniref:RNA polymerase sigma factor n=1 Tax=Allomuricauda sp. SCSIO 65647 TaxID=2908843 RepID=UPI001F323856|nr:RNA polymerase sigma factor [Muricauda sp. SCSIO 65647]UJH68433.1 RNA polymerase sigma factor [Muricauda sp. SCSIO 65647]
MEALTDNALMLKVRSGDIDKLGLLYERHKRNLFGFFYNMSRDSHTSEDMVQTVFIRMLKYKHTFTGTGSFGAWMYKMARNVYYDHFKKLSRNGTKHELSQIHLKDEDVESPEEHLYVEETRYQLNTAISRLSPKKREVLLLCKYRGLKFSEVGEVLGCSEGAAKVKAHRALQELRTIFFELEKR